MSTRASPFFVVAAVIVPGDRDADLRAARDGMCRGLDKPVDTVLHWSDNIRRHDQRKYVASALGALDFVRIAYVVVDKARLRAGASGLSDHSRMYNYAIRRLLERISWFVDACGGEAIVTFAHVRRFPYEKLTQLPRPAAGDGDDDPVGGPAGLASDRPAAQRPPPATGRHRRGVPRRRAHSGPLRGGRARVSRPDRPADLRAGPAAPSRRTASTSSGTAPRPGRSRAGSRGGRTCSPTDEAHFRAGPATAARVERVSRSPVTDGHPAP